MKLLAFHKDPKIKEKYLARVEMHRLADHLIHGSGWENGKGCAIGCTLETYNHKLYPKELGIPEEIAYLEDVIFEGLENGDAQLWPEKFLITIKPGADLSMVWPKFAVWLLGEEQMLSLVQDPKWIEQKNAIIGVRVLYQKWIKTGKKPSEDKFSQAARAAWAAGAAQAAWAAWAAEAAWADRAAQAARAARAAEAAWAAWAAEAAWADRAAQAARAAWAAEAAWADRAAQAASKNKFWTQASDKLIELLKKAK